MSYKELHFLEKKKYTLREEILYQSFCLFVVVVENKGGVPFIEHGLKTARLCQGHRLDRQTCIALRKYETRTDIARRVIPRCRTPLSQCFKDKEASSLAREHGCLKGVDIPSDLDLLLERLDARGMLGNIGQVHAFLGVLRNVEQLRAVQCRVHVLVLAASDHQDRAFGSLGVVLGKYRVGPIH